MKCGDGQCGWRCDGSVECFNGEDETDCPFSGCDDNEFYCGGETCIMFSSVCDGKVDCQDGSDERECPDVPCREGQFECQNGQCIDIDLKCNARYDCADYSDELNCGDGSCRPGEFSCNDGRGCIIQRLRCNSIMDCLDGSDEIGCGGPQVDYTVELRTYPREQTIQEGNIANIALNLSFVSSFVLAFSFQELI